MMIDDAIAKPPPAMLASIDVNIWTAPFWDAAAQHRLVLPCCGDCARYRMPPTPFCPHCRSQAIDWVPMDGNGLLYSYTVVTRAIMPGMEDDLPYVPAIIEFPQAQGVRLISNIVGAPIGDIRIGAHVAIAWRDLKDGIALPVFTIIGQKEV